MTKCAAKTPKSEASRRFFDFFIRVCIIFSSTAVVSVMAISMVNDSLSLFKPEREALVSASNMEELIGALEQEEIVDYPWLFSAYVKMKGGLEFDSEAEISVNSDMDYRQLWATCKRELVKSSE